MDLSIIIVCYRGWERLSKCLDALDSFTGRDFSMEVIVVDNNSADGRIDGFEKKYQKFRFIRNRINGGYSNGCNLGASHASGNNLLFLNPDTVAAEQQTGKLLEVLNSNPDYYIISCRQVREDGRECRASGSFPGLFGKRSSLQKKNALKENVSFPDWISGSVMMMRREIFNKLHGFDEEYWMYSEDVDICRRARDLGGEIAFYNNITIEHNHGGSSRIDIVTTSVTKTEVQISRHLYIHKHIEGIERALFHALIIADNILTGIITGITGLCFFFIPKLFVRTLIFIGLLRYYFDSLLRRSWISRRSVSFI